MKQGQDQRHWHELQVFATNGRVFQVSMKASWEVVTSPLYVQTMVLFSVMVALFDAPVFDVDLPLIWRFFYWLADCVFVTLLWLVQARIMIWLISQKNLPLRNYSLMNTIINISAMVWLNYAFSVRALDLAPLSALQVWQEVLRYSLIGVVIEVLVIAFIMPRFDVVKFLPSNAAQPGAPHVLRVNDREIPVRFLQYIKSVEHYVELVTDTGILLERAPLKALTEQLDDGVGIQPHRSYWVARKTVPVLHRAGGGHVLRLRDGTEIPVSRGRRKLVEQWLRHDNPDHDAGSSQIHSGSGQIH